MSVVVAIARGALGAAALIVIGAALAEEDYGDMRGPMIVGAVAVLILLSGFRTQWRDES